jgi:tetratricopeptide (TPR) repeat protein
MAVQDGRIAELVVQRRLLTEDQLSECLQVQGQSPTPVTLAQVIVSRRYATPDALRALVAAVMGGSTSQSGAPLPSGSQHGVRPTGSWGSAAGSSSTSGPLPRSTGSFPAVDDVDVGFGRYLIAQGHITADQAREGYKHLTTYKQQFPQVNLSQVLAKHALCDKETLRTAYQRYMTQRDGLSDPGAAPLGAAPSADQMVTLDAPAPASSSSRAEPRFGFKTVELDPQERPDFPQKAAPPGSALFGGNPFANAQVPSADAGNLDDFLPIDSSAQNPRPAGGDAPPRFVENETLVDRPRATGGFGPAGFPPAHQPARVGPGATAGESKWATNETGPNGTHAGPRGTHRQRGFGADTGGFMPAAQPVQLPPPIQLKPDLDDEDEEDGGLDLHVGGDGPDDEDLVPAGKVGKKKKAAGDTDVQSSTFGAAKKQRKNAPAAARAGTPVAVIAGVAGVVVLVLSLGLWMLAQRIELKNAKREFLGAIGTEPSEVSLRRRETLPAKLLTDPEVAEALKKLTLEVDKARARRAAEEELAKLGATKSLDERMAICNRAIEADPSYAQAYVARGRVKYAVVRRGAIAAGREAGRTASDEAMQDIDLAIDRDPTSALAYFAKAQLYLTHLSDPDSKQKAQSSLQNVVSQDPEGPLGALAQGVLEQIKRAWDPAIEHYNRAINADPKLVDGYLLRAEARIRKREYAAALTDAAAAARMDPNSSDALTLLAEARYFSTHDSTNRSGDRQGAMTDLDKALTLDPSNGRALAMRAYARLERDRIGDLLSPRDDQELARKDARAATLVDPEQPLGHLALAEIEYSQRNMAEALRHASKAVERGRHLAIVYLVRGRLRAIDGDDQAIQDFDEVLRLEPGNARALTNKAALLIARQEFDNARACLDLAITTDRELAEAHFQRGLVYLKQRPRQYQLAIDDLSKAIELKPQFADAYFYRALAFHDMKQWDQCIDDLAKAESQRKDEGRGQHVREIYLTRGHCLYQKREWRAALETYNAYLGMATPGSKPIDKVKARIPEIEKAIAGESIEPIDDDTNAEDR